MGMFDVQCVCADVDRQWKFLALLREVNELRKLHNLPERDLAYMSDAGKEIADSMAGAQKGEHDGQDSKRKA